MSKVGGHIESVSYLLVDFFYCSLLSLTYPKLDIVQWIGKKFDILVQESFPDERPQPFLYELFFLNLINIFK